MSFGAHAQDSSDTFILEEIIVTAQKREQSLQDVPIAVTPIRGEQLNSFAAGGEDIRILSGRIPGLNAESSNGRVAPRFYIRGLGNTDFDLAASQPVSIIMDDVVMERVVLKSFPLFDIERVEVLRGPQGTLFGRNTPAGIVKFDSIKPGDEAEGYVSASYGNLGNRTVRAAATVPVSDTFSVRASGLYVGRSDWIDNAFTGEDDALGGFEDVAGRIIARFTPNDRFEALANVHARSLDGTSSVFRANILTAGSNQLNENYDRDTVFFDGGNNNPQEYDNFGANLKLIYSTDTVDITSITAYERADGFSLGDIDGGFGASFLPEMGPGFIPFPAETQDSIDDLDQFTQELRLSSNTGGALQWQVGLYYFKDDLTITTAPGFIPPSTVTHDNEAWAVFGQLAYDISDKTTVTVGARYTDDQKDLFATFALGGTFTEEASGSRISWDIAVNHAVNDEISLYARVAEGFRAPTIQGRDVAFFGAPSVAEEEVIISYEAGYKATLFENTLRLNAALFYWQVDDLQLSAVGGGGNLVQLVNAYKADGFGYEIEAEWLINENWTFSGSLSMAQTNLDDRGLAVGICAACTIPANDLVVIGGETRARVNDNPLPQAPDYLLNFVLSYEKELSGGRAVFFDMDMFVEGEKSLFLYQSAEYNTKGDHEVGLRAGMSFEDGKYEVSVYGRNITDEDNLKGGIDFNNLTGFVNEPRTYGISVKANF